ncbi:hypothetical protein E4U53_001591 [Claviceps sorghi]|nr:hypothetical protein E4U53_001591 [Claviceps sorghi]
MLSFLMLLYLALGIHAAPAHSGKHAHQAIHMKRLDRHSHKAHAHAHIRASTVSARMYGKGDGIAPTVVYAPSMQMHREGRPEWLRKRF